MVRIAVLVVGLMASCKGTSDDCAVVRDQPASALAELSKRYPNDPVKVAQTIEGCLAPSGDSCDRIAKVIAAIPAMGLAAALPPNGAGLVILQADESTPSEAISRIIDTAKSAGYDNVLFAVKNR